MIDDVLIFKKVKSGDIRAFETLFRRYYEPLCRYCCSFVGAIEEAEEIVQELFYKIWKEHEKLQITFSGKAYLYAAVRNNSLQYLEHLQIRQNYYTHELNRLVQMKNETPEELLEYKEFETYLKDTLNQLPERRKTIFIMNRFEGKKYSEIADELSLSVKTIEAEMSKALQVLKEKLRKI